MRISILFLLFLTGCASHSPIAAPRVPASITTFPTVPDWAYYPAQPPAEFFAKWGHDAAHASDAEIETTFSKQFYSSDIYRYAELNRVLSDLDTQMRILFHAEGAPIPQLVIVKDPSPNAFVVPEDSCLKGNLQIVGQRPAAPGKSPFRLAPNLAPESLLFHEDMSVSCLPIPASEEAKIFATLKTKTISRYADACSVEWVENQFRFNCPTLRLSENIRSLNIARTAPYVFVTAGLLAALPDVDQLRMVLAHELGHYHLGHAFDWTNPNSYFYDRASQKSAFRPPADPSLKDTGALLLRLGSFRSGRSLPGYFAHAESGLVAFGALKMLADPEYRQDLAQTYTWDAAACAPLDGAEARRVVRAFLYADNLSAKDESAARTLFTQLKACAQSMVYLPTATYKYESFFSYELGTEVMRYILGNAQPDAAPNAWEAFRVMDKRINDTLNELHTGETLRRTGYYTFEEEADVFATNYILLTGQSPALLQEGLANLLRFDLQQSSARNSELTDCLKAYESGWKLHGQPYTPLPLDFNDPHHGFCFRLYNIGGFAGSLGPTVGAVPPPENRISKQDYASIREFYLRQTTTLTASSTAGEQFLREASFDLHPRRHSSAGVRVKAKRGASPH